jgi:opacity protein-like surface antigen
MLNGVGKLPLNGPVTPYAIAGLGMSFLSMSDPTITYNGQDVTALAGVGKAPSESDFAIDFGAGAEFKIAKSVGLFLDFRYVLIFTKTENTSFIPITVGASFYI